MITHISLLLGYFAGVAVGSEHIENIKEAIVKNSMEAKLGEELKHWKNVIYKLPENPDVHMLLGKYHLTKDELAVLENSSLLFGGTIQYESLFDLFQKYHLLDVIYAPNNAFDPRQEEVDAINHFEESVRRDPRYELGAVDYDWAFAEVNTVFIKEGPPLLIREGSPYKVCGYFLGCSTIDTYGGMTGVISLQIIFGNSRKKAIVLNIVDGIDLQDEDLQKAMKLLKEWAYQMPDIILYTTANNYSIDFWLHHGFQPYANEHEETYCSRWKKYGMAMIFSAPAMTPKTTQSSETAICIKKTKM